jgi:hypothetical protein
MQIATTNGPAPQLEELSRSTSHVTFGYGNVIIAYSSASPDTGYLDSHVREVLRYGQRYPDGMGLLILISSDEPPPSEATRALLRNIYGMLKSVIHAAVLIVEGEGFMASAKRSVITLFAASASQPFPIKVAGTTAEGAAKIAKLLGPTLDPRLNPSLIAAALPAAKARLSD